MPHSTRRQFCQAAAAAGTGLFLGQQFARAIDPIRRNGKSHIRLSLAAYSYRKYLDLKIKPKPPMTLFEFADLAAEMGLPAIEPTAYYFADTSADYLAGLKGHCTRLGLDISGTAIGNDFCVADPKKLKEQIAHTKKWVEHASLIGAKTIRIFAGTLPKGDSEEKARGRCVEAIQESCDYAAKFGIFLALENHGGITARAEQILAIVQAVKHDWFGVNWDTGNFRTEDPYGDLQKLAPYAVTVQMKTEIQVAGKKKEDADLSRLFGILRSVSYRGYVALEYEADEDPKTAIPRHIEAMKKLAG